MLIEIYLHGYVWTLAILLAHWPPTADYRTLGFTSTWQRDLGAAFALAVCWPYLLWWFYRGRP